ncbi:ubiquitin-like domain-containing protein [Aggregatilineales bacterium SYSU G02658]
MKYPPISPDDTQPTRLLAPTDAPKRRLWLALMLAGCGSLLLTVALWGFTQRSQPPTPTPFAVVIMQGGQRSDVQTTARTVAELLQAQGITLQPQDALSMPLEATLSAGDVLTIARARDVSLRVDGVASTLRTPFSLPFDILRQAGLTVGEHDRVWLDDLEVSPAELVMWPLPVTRIMLERAVTITLVDEDETRALITTADTVGEALFEAGVLLYLADEVAPDVAAVVEDGMTVQIVRAQPLRVEADGVVIETRTRGATVGEALAEAGVALMGLDRVEPDEGAPVEPGMTIRIIRVTEDLLTRDEDIPFETQFVADPELPLDQRAIRQVGQLGVRRFSERVRYENGVEVSREDVGEEVVQAPRPQIVAYGTRIVLYTVDTPDGPLEYWRKLRVYATSYHPAELGGDSVTAIGETLRRGIVGADPRIIPYRTQLYVPGYGRGMMADTGGPRSSPFWIDLGYSDEDFVGWARYVDVYLLPPVPANIPYLLPEWRPLRGTVDRGN